MILVTGATGFLGKRVCNNLDEKRLDYTPTSLSLGTDLRDADATRALFEKVQPEFVLNCAAFVGGIQFGYKYPADMFKNNLLMTINLLDQGSAHGVRRIVNPISNCAYPGRASYFREDEFWDGPLHESVMTYGFVRKASWVGAWAYARQYRLDVINIILSNMYGPEDHFDEERSHALGALVKKIVEAKLSDAPSVSVWGTGKPVREWLHIDDGAEAMVRGMSVSPTVEPINIGIGKGISVADMAALIAAAADYRGELALDPSKPDGAAAKTVDGSRGARHFGWLPEQDFSEGIRKTVAWYLEHRKQ